MQTVVRITLLAASMCACSSGTRATPDGGNPGSDGPSGGAGLHVQWGITPAVPGQTGTNVTVKSVLFRVDDLRVIGDAGSGDPRTSREDFQLSWMENQQPEPIAFPDAPTGLYSKVTIQADGHLVDDSYAIAGTARVSDVTWDFQIHDREALTANIDIMTTLDPGGEANVPIRVRLDHALGVIDFSTLRQDGGHLELDTLDTQMATFRAALATSFVYDTSITHLE
jgi:hypothetical protein